MKYARLAGLACLAILFSLPLHAQDAVRINLPLEGFYRPGKYIPIAIQARIPGGHELEITADGVMPVRIQLNGGVASGVVPLLVLDQPRRPSWEVRRADGTRLQAGRIDAQWRRLEPTQRLAASATGDISPARQLLGSSPIIPIRLDNLDPLTTPAAAWECLSALILDSTTNADIALQDFLNAGVPVISLTRPNTKAPWTPIGSVWVARHAAIGPTASADWPAALSAVQGWQADWPAALRTRIILYAAAFSLLALAATLLRRRWISTATIVLLSISTCAGLFMWWKSRSPVLARQGTIIVTSDPNGFAQYDSWSFLASARATTAQYPWDGGTRAFFESPSERKAANLHLQCDSSGFPLDFHLRLAPGLKVAFLSRTIAPAPNLSNLAPRTSPELSLHVTRLYLDANIAILGESQEEPRQSSSLTQWRPLFLKASTPP